MNTIIHKHSPDNLTVNLDRDLPVRAIIRDPAAESSISAREFLLKAEDGPYDLILIQNPLIDYDNAMMLYQKNGC